MMLNTKTIDIQTNRKMYKIQNTSTKCATKNAIHRRRPFRLLSIYNEWYSHYQSPLIDKSIEWIVVPTTNRTINRTA